MARWFVLILLFISFLDARTEVGKFEGIWKTEDYGKPYALLMILSDHPPRGTLARTAGGIDLYIQDVKIAKGVLRFKTIDPNDGVVQYELKIVSPTESTLSIGGKQLVKLRRN
jgi:hypothetical protein